MIEDGFIRSVGLGSDLLPPLSIVVDRRGVHYDPSQPSDLEACLAESDFPAALLVRAEALVDRIRRERISKYGVGEHADDVPDHGGRRRVLVTGQVEDDQSVLLGGCGVTGNLDLLARARAAEPDAELWFRPHPDVEAGHRRGAIPDADVLRHADRIVRDTAMTTLLDRVDGVHVLTSLAGFEALLRGRDVTTHGQPFYAGWGLTRDLALPIARRTRRLTVTQLAAATLILYPRYLDPVTGLPCPPEVVVRRFAARTPVRASWLTRIRRIEGRVRRSLSARPV
jgi:capsular polysaccharide export protein